MSEIRVAAWRMPAEASLDALTLRVRNRDASLAFYRDLLGLRTVTHDPGRTVLAPEGRFFALELSFEPGAPVRTYPAVGLYHFALLLPDRVALARVFRRLHDAGASLEGVADHGVSEALYLHDPEGNGIELYRDRPPESWPRRGGDLAMTTAPLDLSSLLREAAEGGALDETTRLGHVHLHVPDLVDAEAFFAGALGLNVMQRSYPGALFFAAGTYHHHVGANVWAGGRRAPPDSTGLLRYRFRVPPETVSELRAHLERIGHPHEKGAGGLVVRDPAGIRVEVGVSPGA
jgi:catechol 2,3-dioxygenase